MSQGAESLEVNLTQYAALWGVSKATVDGMRTSTWTPVDTDADMATQHSIHGLRSRSRQQIQDNPVATSAIKQYVTNVVGVGMSPRLVLSDQKVQEDLQNWWRYTEQAIAMRLGLDVLIQVELMEGDYLPHDLN